MYNRNTAKPWMNSLSVFILNALHNFGRSVFHPRANKKQLLTAVAAAAAKYSAKLSRTSDQFRSLFYSVCLVPPSFPPFSLLYFGPSYRWRSKTLPLLLCVRPSKNGEGKIYRFPFCFFVHIVRGAGGDLFHTGGAVFFTLHFTRLLIFHDPF